MNKSILKGHHVTDYHNYIYILLKIHFYNKPKTGIPWKDVFIELFRSDRGKDTRAANVVLVAISMLVLFVMGIITIHSFKQDGAYAFYNRSVRLNEYMRSGAVPPDGTYVTLDFNMIGDEFSPIAYENPGVYYPVVLKESKGSSGRPHVVAEYIHKFDKDKLTSFKEEHKSRFNGSDSNGNAGLAYDGRIVKFTDEMNTRYNEALKSSGISEKDYAIMPYVINCRVDKEKIRNNLIVYLAICHALFSFGLVLFISYLIDEGKLD